MLLMTATMAEEELAETAGGLFGLGIIGLAGFGLVGLIWYILVIIGDWKLFAKADKPGWHSMIPILNMYDEYDICWKGSMGIVYMIMLLAVCIVPSFISNQDIASIVTGILALVAAVLRIIQSYKLSKVFGHGIIFAIFMILFERLGRLILGLGGSEYEGKDW